MTIFIPKKISKIEVHFFKIYNIHVWEYLCKLMNYNKNNVGM